MTPNQSILLTREYLSSSRVNFQQYVSFLFGSFDQNFNLPFSSPNKKIQDFLSSFFKIKSKMQFLPHILFLMCTHNHDHNQRYNNMPQCQNIFIQHFSCLERYAYIAYFSETVFTAHSHFCQARFQFPFCLNRDALNLLCSFCSLTRKHKRTKKMLTKSYPFPSQFINPYTSGRNQWSNENLLFSLHAEFSRKSAKKY